MAGIPTKLICDECVCLAICKNKKKISCDILNKLAFNVPQDDFSIRTWWGVVRLTLPNLCQIRGEHEDTM